ncbi:MAG: hypothetical protein KDD43_14405, partial [Bdellovibrionales bacterium]|nr:hypothetical protein [Bdellovibrionales bacterium]
GLTEKFATLLEIRSQASKVLEDLRKNKVIGSSLDAQLSITAEGPVFKVLEQYQKDLREFLIVSHVKIQEGKERKIEAVRAEGEKCVRCWHYSLETGKDSRFPEVCPKCVEALA